MSYKSLYEYLGRRAGSELGKIVFETARQDKVVMQQKEVANPVYTGKVMTYPTEWLDQYFDKLKKLNNGQLPL
jgi:uncharacterized protein YydD (DUF2326 family)